MFMFKNKRGRQGYSIIEFLVAMSVFAVVIVVVFSLFSMIIRGQRRVIAQQNVQENARFLMDFLSKEIRMGTIGGTTNGNSPNLALTRSNGVSVTYNISGNKITRNSVQANSDEVIITGSFYVEGKSANDNLQPKVTIVLGVQGVGNKIEEKVKINVQTTLSPRNLDL
jgi:prepilin-type N-terminal cleavage/methylation domain-containing protein